MQLNGMPAGGLAPHDLTVLRQVRLGLSGFRTPVSRGVLAVSSRIVMNNVGCRMSNKAAVPEEPCHAKS